MNLCSTSYTLYTFSGVIADNLCTCQRIMETVLAVTVASRRKFCRTIRDGKVNLDEMKNDNNI